MDPTSGKMIPPPPLPVPNIPGSVELLGWGIERRGTSLGCDEAFEGSPLDCEAGEEMTGRRETRRCAARVCAYPGQVDICLWSREAAR